MGFPGLQDGRLPRGDAGAGRPAGPVSAELPDEEAAVYRPGPVPGAEVAPYRASGGPGNGAPGGGAPGNGGPSGGPPPAGPPRAPRPAPRPPAGPPGARPRAPPGPPPPPPPR